MLAKLIRSLLFRLDVNRGFTFEAASLPAALRRLARRGLTINTVIDVGASNGQWSEEVVRFFPSANYLLIEAQGVHCTSLKEFSTRHSKAHIVLKAAGSKSGTVLFDADDPFSGQAVDRGDRLGLIEVPLTTIDAEIARLNLTGPYLVKLDVHGYELPILEGATHALSDCALAIIECYNFKIAENSLLFHDMCRHMEQLGFRVIDFSEPLWRKRDEALWQMDLFFIPASHRVFDTSSYQ